MLLPLHVLPVQCRTPLAEECTMLGQLGHCQMITHGPCEHDE